MRRLRGQPRAVYRVYGEDEYLAGVDPFADFHAPPAEPASHLAEGGAPAPPAAAVTTREHRLRRLAGAAALTGAVGTVGGTIGLVGLRSHPVDRQIAANVSPSARIIADARREVAHRVLPSERSPRAVARRSRLISRPEVGVRPGVGVMRVSPRAHVSDSGSPAPEPPPARPTPSPVVNTAQDAPVTSLASASQNAPAETEVRPLAQSEFGFER